MKNLKLYDDDGNETMLGTAVAGISFVLTLFLLCLFFYCLV